MSQQFFSTLTQSQAVVAELQARFGTIQPGKLEVKRKQFYSYLTYPLPGTSELNFFGNAIGNNNTTRQDTNMEVQGSFGTSHFLIKSIRCKYFIANRQLVAYDGTDATTLFTEFMNGLFQAGYLRLDVNAKNYIEINKPFIYAGSADGGMEVYSGGQVNANTDSQPFADLCTLRENLYLVEPEIFIAAQQTFTCKLLFPSGNIPVRATGVITVNNPLRVGVSLDGLEIRPVQ